MAGQLLAQGAELLAHFFPGAGLLFAQGLELLAQGLSLGCRQSVGSPVQGRAFGQVSLPGLLKVAHQPCGVGVPLRPRLSRWRLGFFRSPRCWLAWVVSGLGPSQCTTQDNQPGESFEGDETHT